MCDCRVPKNDAKSIRVYERFVVDEFRFLFEPLFVVGVSVEFAEVFVAFAECAHFALVEICVCF